MISQSNPSGAREAPTTTRIVAVARVRIGSGATIDSIRFVHTTSDRWTST